MRTLLLLALAVLALLGALRLLLPRIVHRFVYFPEPLRPLESDPEPWGFPGADQVFFEAEDGVRLHGWWFEAAAAQGRRGAAVYFHGNAGHLAHRGEVAAALAALGLDVLLFDYRGYGRSEGRPTEEGLYRDGEAAYRFALARSGAGPGRLLLVGNSLGSAVAAKVAARRPVAGVVLAGAFGSTVAVARRAFPWLPGWLLEWDSHRFEAVEHVRRMRAPLLVAAGSRDRTVPPEETRRVYEAAPAPKRWYEARGAGHNDLFAHPGLFGEIRRFVSEVLGAGEASVPSP